MELLSPAGGTAQLKAAIQSGADAVYMGGPKFGARYSAQNFTLDEMRTMIEYCHLYGADAHITVNTLIKETELEEAARYLYALNDMCADALIIQDLGLARLAREIIPDMPLHASTQMTVTSQEGVKYLKAAGFSRVVLARELSKEEIYGICRSTDIEIEVFVHGAICMCYSGQCLMSSILGGRSGNRGRCAQPCRLPYELVKDGKAKAHGYLLSPKDMALIEELGELEKIGVTSLKIEGRLKRPEYVSAVTGVYRKYLDYPSRVSRGDLRELQDAFSRSGFTDGYFTSRLGKEMMSHENPSNAPKNTFTEEAKKRAEENANIRKIPVNISASLIIGSEPEVVIYDNDGNYASAKGGAICEKADSRPIDTERVKKQLEKLGQTPFEAERTDVFANEGVTVSISALNEARREAAKTLTDMRSQRVPGRKCGFEIPAAVKREPETAIVCSVRTREQARAASEAGIERIYAPAWVVDASNSAFVTALSPIYHSEEIKTRGVLAPSGAAVWAYSDRELYGDFRLNVTNSMTANAFEGLKSVTLSPELNLGEIKAVTEKMQIPAEVIGYGKIGLMLMKNCPVKALGHCRRDGGEYRLRDRKHEEFSFICHEGCVCELLNSKPIFMADKMRELLETNIDYIRLVFTDEDYRQCKEIIQLYKAALCMNKIKNPFEVNGFTRGHFFRGVE
ncbi:MAG: U32 family peptidase [Clostridiales bacterium]|nr:U32 family peptidase [Clostridiales bacterium]